MNIAKKTLSSVVVSTTILWSMGASMLVGPLTAHAAATDGSLIKAKEIDAVYYYMGGKRWTFPNLKTYKTWFKDFTTVKVIPMSELQTYQLSGNVVYRAGTRLVKITTDPKVYAVEPSGKLRWVKDEATAKALFGNDWAKRVDDVSDAFFTNYSIGADLSTAVFPDGTLLSKGSEYFYIEAGKSRAVDAAALSGNNLNTAYAIAVADLSAYPAGAALGATAVANVAQGSVAGQPPAPGAPAASTGSLSIALASDSPASGNSIVVDTTGDQGGQKLARMAKVNFTSNGGDVVVTQVQATRGGISKDGDVDYVYLADANGKVLAKNNSLSVGVATFINANGIFTVPAGQTVSVWVLEDVNRSSSVGSTQSWAINAAGVKTNSSGTVTGSAAGPSFTVAAVTDLGQLEYATSSPLTALTVDAGKVGYTLGTFRTVARDQDILLKKIKFTQIGSIATTDLANLKLMVGGVQYDATKSLAADNTLSFDLSAHADGGLKILAGQTKFLDIVGDIVGGTNRNYRFSVQNSEDISAWDLNYKVFVGTYSLNTDAFAVETLAISTINSGTLSLTLASDTPSLNVALNGTGVVLGKFKFTPSGEDVKLTSLSVSGDSDDNALVLKNVKLMLDGVQVGTTDASLLTDNFGTADEFTFTNNFIVRVGKPSVLEVVADLNDTTAAANDTVQVRLVAGTSNAQGLTSLTNISTAVVSANILTLKTGAPSVQQNAAVPSGTSSEPTAVYNDRDVKVGSIAITGGSGEGSKITSIALQDDAAALTTNFARLRLTDAAGVQIGNEIATGAASSTYTFTLSPALALAKGEQKVVHVIADVLSASGAFATTAGPALQVKANGITYQTTETGLSGTVPTNALELQNVYVASAGTLTGAASSDTPLAAQVVMGTETQPILKFNLTAGKAEDINVSEVAASFIISVTATSPTGVLQNIRLLDGDKVLGTASGLSYSDTSATANASNAYARFSALNGGAGVVVPKNTTKTLTVVAGIAATQDVYSSSTIRGVIVNGYDTSAASSAVVAKGAKSGTVLTTVTGVSGQASFTGATVIGNTLRAYKTKLSVAYDTSTTLSTVGNRTTEMPAALFTLSNTANVNGAKATITKLNFLVSGSLSAPAGTTSKALKAYKALTSADSALEVMSTTLSGASATAGKVYGPLFGSFKAFGDTPAALATSIVVEPGASVPLLVTVNTDGAATGAASLNVGMEAGSITWGDGVTTGITTVNTLPLSGRSISFSN